MKAPNPQPNDAAEALAALTKGKMQMKKSALTRISQRYGAQKARGDHSGIPVAGWRSTRLISHREGTVHKWPNLATPAMTGKTKAFTMSYQFDQPAWRFKAPDRNETIAGDDAITIGSISGEATTTRPSSDGEHVGNLCRRPT